MDFDSIRGLVAQAYSTAGITTPYYYFKAPRESVHPYVVASRISETPQTQGFGNLNIDRAIFQFSVYTAGDSPAQGMSIVSAIRAVFDNLQLAPDVYSTWHSTLPEMPDEDAPEGGTIQAVRFLITFRR